MYVETKSDNFNNCSNCKKTNTIQKIETKEDSSIIYFYCKNCGHIYYLDN